MSDGTATSDSPGFHWLRRLPVVEVLLLMIGAAVALALDDWREAGERAERDGEVIALLLAELESNRSRLLDEVAYHREIDKPMQAAWRRMSEEGVFAMPENWQGVLPIALTRTAFDLAAMTNTLARLPAETAIRLSRVYEEMEATERSRANVSLATWQTSFSDGVRYMRLQLGGVQMEIEAADRLVPLFEEAVAALEASGDVR